LSRPTPQFERSVFLNVPFDRDYEGHLLALIAGTTAFGLVPRSALDIEPETSGTRLQRLFTLLRSCRYSLHDLSRVGVGRGAPRFNMPFEAGLACALELAGSGHRFYVLERRRHRLQRTCSDLNGIDPQIHEGRPRGVLRCLLNLFGRAGLGIDVPDLLVFYEIMRSEAREIRRESLGGQGLFEPAHFRRLVLAGQATFDRLKNEVRPAVASPRARVRARGTA
jgi:hypothetical protein